jgi:hypothetical protein
MKIPKTPGGRVQEYIKLKQKHEKVVDKRGKHSKEAKELSKQVEQSSASLRRWLG